MSYCPNCGKEVSSEARYCPYCGASLEITGEVREELPHEKVTEVRQSVIAGYILAGFGVFLTFITLFLVLTTNIRNFGILVPLIVGIITVVIGMAISFYYHQRLEFMKRI